MHKKLAAVLTIAIFAISTFAIVSPVSAHFTLGDLTGTYRYHNWDFDPHVSKGNGVIGYVWPGGGLNAYSGFPNFATVNQPPGYQSPYPGGKPGTAGGYLQSGNAPSSSWYQLEGDAYSPFGAVLAGSTGDLIFAINSTCWGFTQTGSPPGICVGIPNEGWDRVNIWIPPGFTVPGASQVVSTLSNNYQAIDVNKAGPYDRYGPGWTTISVPVDMISDFGQGPSGFTGSQSTKGGLTINEGGFYVHAINFTQNREWYYIRINGVTAPSVAGRYFFKIALGSEYGSTGYFYGGEEGVAGSNNNGVTGYSTTGGSTGYILGLSRNGMQQAQFIPTENWPVLLVKGEIDPAIITGTIRYAGYNQTLYSSPIKEAGRVYAKMNTRLDPYTGQARPDLPKVDAVGYFNNTAYGHYEIEGVAPGIYDLYASAAGYPQTLIASGITILRGQSLHFDGYLQPGVVIHGNIFTKHQFGDEPWPASQGAAPGQTCGTVVSNGRDVGLSPCTNEYIKVELYDGPTVSHIPASSAHMVSWSPMPCIAGGQELFYYRRDAGYCGDPRISGEIGFPWHEYTPANGYYSGPSPTNFGFFQVATGSAVYSNAPMGGSATNAGYGSLQFNKLTQDPQGVGPPQHWFVQGGTTIPFHFEFGVKGEYGAPRDLDGMVPQMYATWVNGLTPGRYYARAWTFRYVQAALDGSTFQEYYFDVTPNEWAGDVTLPIDLRLSSWVNKTVHFHNVINGITEDPIDTGGSMMSGVLVDSSGIVWSYNQSLLGYKNYYPQGRYSGADPFGAGGLGSLPDPESAWNCLYTNMRGNVAYSATRFVTCTDLHENDMDPAKLNKNAIEQGRANIQFWGFNDTWGGENYGIPSGTYQPHVFMQGYLENSPVEFVSVTLSGNPTSISDHMYRGVGFNVTVFSIDWQRPRVQRNWVWGNPTTWPYPGVQYNTASFGGGQVGGLGSYGNAAQGCGVNGQPGYPYPMTFPNGWGGTCLVGQEIDVGFYQNGTLVSMAGDEIWDDTATIGLTDLKTSCLYQNYTSSAVQMCGGGWDTSVLLPWNQSYVPYQGQAHDAFFGTDLGRVGFVGGYLAGSQGTLTATALNGNAVAHFSPSKIPGTPDALYNTIGSGYPGLYPTAFPGGQYDLRAYTYGYVQNQAFSVYGMPGQIADSRINLVIGVNVTIDILFKKEHIITPTAANMSARVRLFNDQSNLVAEWMSSEGTYAGARASSSVGPGKLLLNGGQPQSGFATAATGETQFPFANIYTVPLPYPANTLPYLPGGITELKVLLAGLPSVPGGGFESGPNGVASPQGAYFGDPAVGKTVSTGGFGIDVFGNPGVNWNAPGYYPNYGILGASDYQGGWTAEVDFVNLYSNSTGCAGITSYPYGPGWTTNCVGWGVSNSTYGGGVPQYYPPVAGLLMGESYHIIPGTTAKSGISLTEDMSLSAVGKGISLAPNHLGPYSQQGVWQIANAHNSGEASAIFEVDLNGLVTGNALAFNWANEFRTLSWGTITVTGAGLPSTGLNFYTYDGHYEAYLPGTRAGASGSNSYKFTLSSPGLAPQTWTTAVSSGMTGTGQNLYLQESNIPVPEFSGLIVAAFSALAASVYVLRRRRN